MSDERLERQLHELRQTYDLDVACLRAERDEARVERERARTQRDEARKQNAMLEKRLSHMVIDSRGVCDIEAENVALADALRVRIECQRCPECRNYLEEWGDHKETCRDHETEKKALQQ